MTFEDPLGVLSSQDSLPTEDTVKYIPRLSRRITKGASDERAEAAAAEWDAYKLSIMQRFTSTGTITVSAVRVYTCPYPRVRPFPPKQPTMRLQSEVAIDSDTSLFDECLFYST